MPKKQVVKLTTTPEDAKRAAETLTRMRGGKKKYAAFHATGKPGEKAEVFITQV